MQKLIDTEIFSDHLRKKAIILDEKKVLIARIEDSEQEKDLTTPVNCNGYGRVRHFRYHTSENWSNNPLPIFPACKALGKEPDSILKAQVYQNSACNWRCWYCFVDFNRLSANTKYSEFFTSEELIDMYLSEDIKCDVIDITGGQPDLTPEWLLWMMQAAERRGLKDKVFFWSDDNLSNDYFWRFLTESERKYIATYPKYSRVACFKGYNDASFVLNTLAKPELFSMQFDVFKRLLQEGIDMYAYVTLTGIPEDNIKYKVEQFVDRLQSIHPNLPLRTVPLKVDVFTPTISRVQEEHRQAMDFQFEVHNHWENELVKRFSPDERSKSICDIPLIL